MTKRKTRRKAATRRARNPAPIAFGSPGLPAKDSVTGRERFRSPRGVEYEILKTNERDAYDRTENKRRKR